MSCATRTSCPSSKCSNCSTHQLMTAKVLNKLYCLYFVYMFVLLYVCLNLYVCLVFVNKKINKEKEKIPKYCVLV